MKKCLTYCGYIGLIGKTNVGKSTLLNKIIGKKISITSHKSGTTIKNIIGVKNILQYQLIYIDTPGLQNTYGINCNKTILYHNYHLNLIIFMINKTIWNQLDDLCLKKIKKYNIPTILIINKIDFIKKKTILLPFIQWVRKKYQFISILPLSAKTGENINILLEIIKKNIPSGPHVFPSNYTTNVSKIFMISEIIREKFIRLLHHELPYLIQIKIDSYKVNRLGICNIFATIFVQKDKHKKIIIGVKGKKIKQGNLLARNDIKKYLEQEVNLYIWVRKKI
ncbi:GTPase Era [Buchnera aphidicola (Pterocallis alni)]|uniref:GTPase Era n=1 Tax=Buchnera aphidicola TaxID=9 RepID=UPI003464CF6C